MFTPTEPNPEHDKAVIALLPTEGPSIFKLETVFFIPVDFKCWPKILVLELEKKCGRDYSL